MGVYQYINPSGKQVWYADWYDATGKRKRKKFRTRREAEQALAKYKTDRFQEAVMGIKREKKLPFIDLKEEFLKFSRLNKKHRTYISHQNSIDHLEKRFKIKNIQDITAKDIQEYKDYRLRKVSLATVNRELACFKYMLNMAERWGLVKNTIARQIKIELKKEGPGRIRFLSKEEMKKFLEACERGPVHLKYVVLIALNTGMRKGEILSMRWHNIDLANRVILVKEVEYKNKRDTPKDSEMRGIPINDVLYKALLEWKKIQAKQIKPGTKVFDLKDIRTSFKTALRKAGIKDFRFNDLRHTFASHLVMNKVDLPTVSNLLGHSTIQMTMRYSHLSSEHKKQAVETFGQFMDSAKNTVIDETG